MWISRFLNSIKYALCGLRQIFIEEYNFRIHSFVAFLVILISIFVFHFSYIELSITLICMALVFTTEIINTAVENTWDHLEPNHHPVVKTVKDMMSGAVLIASFFSAIVWILLIINS